MAHPNLLKKSKDYWESKLPQRWYSKKKYGTPGYWEEITRLRYTKYFPYFPNTIEFAKHRGEKVLEIGIGVGTDLIQFAKHGAECSGVDLTENAVKTTRKRLRMEGLKAHLQVANAERLPFKDNTFDLVYSLGVLHHAPDMQKTIDEAYRVLKPGGKAIIWLYGKDWVYYLLFPLYHGILLGEFRTLTLHQIMHKHMEVEGNVPIVRMFRKKDLYPYFRKFKRLEFIHKGHPGQSLGNRFRRLNQAFAAVMNFLFPYHAWIVKGIK